MSTTICPFESPAATPSCPNNTASTCGVSGTMMMTTSAFSATSLPDLQTTPPSATSSGAIGPTSCRNRRWPAACRWRAIGRPMVPRPIKPISIISNSPLSFLASCSGIGRQRGVPTEALDRRRPRLIFAPDPAAITNSVEVPEQEGIVDFAGARLIAAGIIGKLDMSDARQMFLQGARNVAFHDLHVVDVVLHEQIARADVRDDLKRLCRLVQEEAGNIDRVDRLDQKLDPFPGERVRGEAQISDQPLVQLDRIRAVRRDADQAVELTAIERLGVID